MKQSNSTSIRVSGIDGKNYDCLDIRGENFGFNAKYSLIIKGRSRTLLNYENFSKCVAHLESADWGHYDFSGQLLKLEQKFLSQTDIEFTLTIGSPLHLLDNDVFERSFTDISLSALLQEVIGTTSAVSRKINISKNRPNIAYICQTGISNYDFLIYICAQFGIVFFHEFIRDEVVLVLTDNLSVPNTQDVLFNPGNGMHQAIPGVISLLSWEVALPNDIQLMTTKDGDESIQFKTTKTNQTNITGFGQVDLKSICPIEHQQHAEETASLLQEQLDWQRHWLFAKCQSGIYQPGNRIRIINHPVFSNEKAYQVIETSFNLSLEKSSKNNGLITNIYLIPAKYTYRMPLDSTVMMWPEWLELSKPHCLIQSVEKPIPFLTRSEIVGTKSKSELTEKGDYKLKSFYQRNTKEDAHSVVTARLLQPSTNYSEGDASGLHLVLPPSTRVISTQCNHPFTRPIILGVLPDVEQPSVVTQKNKNSVMIRFKSNTVLEFDESSKYQCLNLYSKNKKHGLLFSKIDEQQVVELRSLQHINFYAKTNVSINSGQGLAMTAKTMMLCSQEKTIFLSQSQLSLNGRLIQFKVENDWLCHSRLGPVVMRAGKRLSTFSEQLTFKSSDFFMRALHMRFFAKTGYTIKADQGLDFSTGPSALTIKNGAIILNGSCIQLSSPIIRKNEGIASVVK